MKKKEETQKPCNICLAWFDKKEIVDGKCVSCREAIKNAPKDMTEREKLEYVIKIKQRLLNNKYKKLYLSEKKKLEICSKCEWLRFIDYFRCKVHCGKPVCERWK